MTRSPLVLSLVLLVLACASGEVLLEEGFTANPAGDRTWWVSYEGRSLSSERARDVLLYNSARLVLDNGGSFFTFAQAETRSRFDRERSDQVGSEPSLGDPAGESHRTQPSMRSVTTISAIVEIVDSPGEAIFDADAVLEELTGKYTR